MLKYLFPFLVFFSGTMVSAQEAKPVSIFGMVRSKSLVDSIELIYYDNNFGVKGNNLPVAGRFTYLPRGGFYQRPSFKFDLPDISKPVYISLKYGKNYFFHHYLIMPGDSIQLFIDLEKNQTVFSGPSAAAFKCQYEIQGIETTQEFELGVALMTGNAETWLNENNNRYLYEKDKEEFGSFGKLIKIVTPQSDYHMERIFKKLTNPPANDQLDILNSYKKQLDPLRYEILKADIIGKTYASIIHEFTDRVYFKNKSNNNQTELKKLDDFYIKFIKPLSTDHVPDELKIYSAYYTDYLIEMAVAKSEAETKRSVFGYLVSNYRGPLRDKLIGRFIFEYSKRMPTKDKMIKEALELVKVPEIYEFLKSLNTNQSKGSIAYNFRLQDEKGQWVEMADLKGKLVLMDFWYTGCVGCKVLNQNILKHVKKHFKDNDEFVIVSISIDKDYKNWIKSVKKGDYTSEEALNLFTMGKGEDHELIKHYDITAYPTLILIDKQGKIAQTDNLHTSSADKLIKILEKWLAEN